MYKNVGGTIKKIATVMIVLGSILCVLIGVGMVLSAAFDGIHKHGNEVLAIYGAVTAILGPVLLWLSYILYYAFGQLVENSDKTVKLLEEQNLFLYKNMDSRVELNTEDIKIDFHDKE